MEKLALDSVAVAHPCSVKSVPSSQWTQTLIGLIAWWVECRMNFSHHSPNRHKLFNQVWQPLSKLTEFQISSLPLTTCMNLRKFYHLSLRFLVYKLNKIIPAFLRVVAQIKKKLHVSRACTWHVVNRGGVLVAIVTGTIILTHFKSSAIGLYSRNAKNPFPHSSQVLVASRFSLHLVFLSLNQPG